jgi:hypothetical protein
LILWHYFILSVAVSKPLDLAKQKLVLLLQIFIFSLQYLLYSFILRTMLLMHFVFWILILDRFCMLDWCRVVLLWVCRVGTWIVVIWFIARWCQVGLVSMIWIVELWMSLAWLIVNDLWGKFMSFRRNHLHQAMFKI